MILRRLNRLRGPRVHRHGVVAVAMVFFTSGASYLVTPILAVLLVERGVPAAISGTLIGLQLFVGRVTTPLTGWLSDRLGARWLVTAGMTCTASAHLGLASAHGIVQLTLLVVLLGVAMALFGPASKSLAVQNLADPAARSRIFAWRNLAAHGGAAVGALCGTMLLTSTGKASLLLGAGIFELIIAALAFMLLPKSDSGVAVVALSRLGAVFRNRRTQVLLIVVTAYWAAYIQLTVGAPLTIESAGLSWLLGPIFAINAVAVLSMQIPVSRLCERMNISPRRSFVWGHLSFVVALPVLGVTHYWAGAPVVFALLISLGVVFGAPAIDTWVTESAGANEMGTFLSVSFVAMGLGAAIGGALGGWAFKLASVSTIAPLLTWTVLAAILLAPLTLLAAWPGSVTTPPETSRSH